MKTLLILTLLNVQFAQADNMDWYDVCRANAVSAGLFLQDRYDGVGMFEMIEIEHQRLTKVINERGMDPMFIEMQLRSSIEEIEAAFEQPFPLDYSKQLIQIDRFKSSYLKLCLEKNS